MSICTVADNSKFVIQINIGWLSCCGSTSVMLSAANVRTHMPAKVLSLLAYLKVKCDNATEGVIWKARDLWSAPVEWSNHERRHMLIHCKSAQCQSVDPATFCAAVGNMINNRQLSCPAVGAGRTSFCAVLVLNRQHLISPTPMVHLLLLLRLPP